MEMSLLNKFHPSIIIEYKKEYKQDYYEAVNKDPVARTVTVYEPADENEIKLENYVFLPSKKDIERTPVMQLFDCPYDCCGLKFKRRKYLVEHMKVTHGKYICKKCNKECDTSGQFQYHMKAYHRHKTSIQLKCTFENCDSTFKTTSGLKYHMLKHTGQKTHICNVCEKAFWNATALKLHVRSHTGEKYLKKSLNDLTEMRILGERPYACDLCQNRYFTSTMLSYHMRSHTGEKPYVCDVCDSRFAQIGHLRTHQKIHT
ncbi:Zinc finger protein, partial [Pseudolycoriella hygida]